MKRKKIPLSIQKQAWITSGGMCSHCGKSLTMYNKTIEHIIPLSKGGSNSVDNLCILCEDCNSKKSNTLKLPSWYAYFPEKSVLRLYSIMLYFIFNSNYFTHECERRAILCDIVFDYIVYIERKKECK